MLRLLHTHPGLRAREPRIAFSIFQVTPVACCSQKLSRAPLHIIGPCCLLIAVWRAVGIALLNTLFCCAQCIDLLTRPQQSLRIFLEARVPSPNLITERHCRGVSPRQISKAGGFTLIFPQTLRPTISEIDDTIAAGTPAIIRNLVLRQSPAFMISIVRNLVKELIGSWMELEHPIEAPARLVQNIRNAVWSRLTELVESVIKLRTPFLVCARPFCLQLKSQQHLCSRVAGGQKVFQKVARVMPPSGRVEICACRQRAVRRAAVERMTDHIEPGVVTTTLLPEEFQKLIRQFGTAGVTDVELRRLGRNEP